MAIPLQQLLNSIPQDTHHRVDQVRKRIGNAVREALRRETGLFLKRHESSLFDEKQTTFSVPVTLVPGLPEILENFKFDDSLAVALMISPHRRDLEQSRDGLKGVLPLIRNLAKHDPVVKIAQGREPSVDATATLVCDLLNIIETNDPLKQLLGVNADILGVYAIKVPRYLGTDTSIEGRVELYWGVLGLVAGMMGVSVEALTAVTLIHELGHVYTHMGADIDGERWGNIAFSESEMPLIEGLAQYYTHLVSQRIDQQIVGTHAAYLQLLKHQPEPYHAHLPWIEGYKPEEIRWAMISIRRAGSGTLKQFSNALAEARSHLRSRKH